MNHFIGKIMLLLTITNSCVVLDIIKKNNSFSLKIIAKNTFFLNLNWTVLPKGVISQPVRGLPCPNSI